MRIGIELEYWAVNREGGLVDSNDIVSECAGVDREFVTPLLEVKTPPCTSVSGLEGHLLERLDRVLEVAGTRDIRLAPVATTLEDVEVRRTEESNPRIDVQRRSSVRPSPTPHTARARTFTSSRSRVASPTSSGF